MDAENRKLIVIISFMRKFISVFFSLFFNIYVLKIVNDVGFIIKVNFISLAFGFIFNTLILKFLNNKSAKYIYGSSFVLLVMCIGLLLGLKENIIKYIYLFKVLYCLAEVAYAGPLEMVIMGSNNHNTFSNFQANMNILNNIATILTPIFSGFIIERFSYTMLFILLVFEAIIIILTSTKITNFYVEDRKTNVREFWDKAKNYSHMKDIYHCMFFRRISAQGALTDLLPIILFLKLDSELSVGAYSSLFAVLSICALSMLKVLNEKNIKKSFYVPFSIVVFASTLLLVFVPSFMTILIYYVCMNTFATVIESESCSTVYASINTEDLKIYNREHDIVFNVYMYIGQVISYGLSYILYSYFYNVNILSIIVSLLMFFLIISCIYLQRTEDFLYKKVSVN